MKKKIIIKPDMEWQVDDYSRTQDLNFMVPYQLLLLCKLVEVTPRQLILDFMDNLSCGSWKREGRAQAKEKLIEYFLQHEYGQGHYTLEDLRQMFKELDAVGMLFPKDDDEMVDVYANWRDKHYKHWIEKWFGKYRRIKP